MNGKLEGRGVKASGFELVVHDLDVTPSPHDDGALAVDVIGGNVEDALDLAPEHARAGNTPSLLGYHGHGDALV